MDTRSNIDATLDGRPRIRIAVINDFEVIVRGVTAMLDGVPDIEVAATEVGDLGDLPPVDVALYDTFGTADPGLGDVTELLRRDSVGRVAVYTSSCDDAAVQRALALGAHGCLSKSLGSDELADALRRIAAGDTVTAQPERVAESATPGRWPGEEQGLTEKESEVLALVVRGLDNQSIAEALYISPDTLKSRIRTLYRRIGATNRVEAVLWGVDHGFRPGESGSSRATADASNA